MKIPTICRYCGGPVRLVPASLVFGASTERLGLENEMLYQCQNCNARVGCHKRTTRPLGDVANEMLRLKRMETHRVFDEMWRRLKWSRTRAYKWLAKEMGLSTQEAHIGGFEMDECQFVIELCQRNQEVA